jgi:hypothetical protein
VRLQRLVHDHFLAARALGRNLGEVRLAAERESRTRRVSNARTRRCFESDLTRRGRPTRNSASCCQPAHHTQWLNARARQTSRNAETVRTTATPQTEHFAQPSWYGTPSAVKCLSSSDDRTNTGAGHTGDESVGGARVEPAKNEQGLSPTGSAQSWQTWSNLSRCEPQKKTCSFTLEK